MESLKPGKDWSEEVTCDGYGNGGEGCGEVYCIKESDLFATSSDHWDSDGTVSMTIKCERCSNWTDVKGVPRYIQKRVTAAAEERRRRQLQSKVAKPEEMADRVNRAIGIAFNSGGADEAHHKAWAIDQMVRVLTGCPQVTATATDADGEPYTCLVLGESEEYKQWVKDYCDGECGPDTYNWDVGIAP